MPLSAETHPTKESSEPIQDRYAIILGTGRSGTNWLLSLFDFSPETLCRNELDQISGSAFERLPERWVKGADDAVLDEQWDEVVRLVRGRIGCRDSAVEVNKVYYNGLANATGFPSWPRRKGIGRILRTLHPAFGKGEWRLAGWVGSQEKLQNAYCLLKINCMSGWAVWLFRNRPHVPLFHIVRHPGGTLNSYRNRFLALKEPEKVLQDNRQRLYKLAELRPDWAEAIGDPQRVDIVESEIWYWRYVIETSYDAGKDHPNYTRILFEELVQDPIGIARDAFTKCGLTWSPQIEQKIKGTTTESNSIAGAWKSRLKPEDLASVERVLGNSQVDAWWPS